MGRHKVYDRKLVTLNLGVKLMEEMKKMYSENVSGKVNEILWNHISSMKLHLQDIDYKIGAIKEEIDKLQDELGLYTKEKQEMLERKIEQEKNQVTMVVEKRPSSRMVRLREFIAEYGFAKTQWHDIPADVKEKILAKLYKSDKK